MSKFMEERWRRVNEMRKTPHKCDYEYIVDSISGQPAFFEICKLCLDTRGVVEISADLGH
jgi:hypothetical protein